MEKAYAKLFGSFEAIEGGKVSIVLSELSGGFSEEIVLKEF